MTELRFGYIYFRHFETFTFTWIEISLFLTELKSNILQSSAQEWHLKLLTMNEITQGACKWKKRIKDLVSRGEKTQYKNFIPDKRKGLNRVCTWEENWKILFFRVRENNTYYVKLAYWWVYFLAWSHHFYASLKCFILPY